MGRAKPKTRYADNIKEMTGLDVTAEAQEKDSWLKFIKMATAVQT